MSKKTFATYSMKRRRAILCEIANIIGDKRSTLYQSIRHIIEAGGKLVRPSFVLLGCEAVGESFKKAVSVAVATELGHVGSLIHDDIIDKDEVRRGVLSVHVKFGIPIAILAGDLLIFKSFHSLVRAVSTLGHKKVTKILDRLCKAAITMTEGESMDVEFLNRHNVTEDQYFNMIMKKTAEAFRAALEVGAIAGGGTKEEIKALSNYGLFFGMAFQIRDDLLGIFGKKDKIGKPASDILRKRRILPIIHALQRGDNKDKDQLTEIMKKRKVSERDVEKVVNILTKCGSISYSETKIVELTEKAKQSLSPLKDTSAKRVLFELADFIAKEALVL